MKLKMKQYKLKSGTIVNESTLRYWEAESEKKEPSAPGISSHRERDLRRRQNRSKRKKAERAMYLANLQIKEAFTS